MKRYIKAEVARKTAAIVAELLRSKRYRVEVCGSLRRNCEEVGDIDIVSNAPIEEIPRLMKDSRLTVHNGIGGASKKLQLEINGIQVDFYVADERNWDAAVLFLTGSAMFNIMMRGEAKRKGFLLNQYGLFRNNVAVAGTEEQIFALLGMKYRFPNERNKGLKEVER